MHDRLQDLYDKLHARFGPRNWWPADTPFEVIVGASTDKAFGPLMMFGLGGTYVELLKDVSFGLHPLTEQDAHGMVTGIKGFKLLEGYRNAPPADVDAIVEILLRVSQLLGDFPEIVEMDINPLKVLKPGEGAIAVDIRMRIGAV